MSRVLSFVALAVIVATPALAQTPAPARPDLTSLSGGVSQLYQSIRRNIVEAAEAMPAHADFLRKLGVDVTRGG